MVLVVQNLLQRQLGKFLTESGITSFPISKTKSKQADCIIVLGGDKGVRNYFHRTFDSTLPVLGISEGEASGFLAQIELREFSTYVNVIKKAKVYCRGSSETWCQN